MGILQQTCLDHVQGALVALFTGLEHELDPALDLVLVVHEQLCRTQQHGSMGIMSAGMHPARTLAGKGFAGLLLHGQGIHIAAQKDHLAIRITVQHGYHTAAHRIGLISHLLQFLGDIGAGIGQIRSYFGVFMDMTAPAHQFAA